MLGLASGPALAVQGSPIASAWGDPDTPTRSATVGLAAGQDYLLEADGFGTAELVNPQGQTEITLQPHMGYPSIVQPFRATWTAVYGLKATYDPVAPPSFVNSPIGSWIYRDCRSDTQTQCRLTPGVNEQRGLIVAMGDRDWYRVTLRKGVRYRFTIATSGGQASLTLRSPSAKLLIRHIAPDGGTAFIDYKAPGSGTYFAAVSLVTQANINYAVSVQHR